MTVIAHNWYNLNSTRRFPLDTAATGESDAGESIPDDVLVDCHLRFPEAAGRYVYISSMHVSASLISLTFLASDTPAKESNCPSLSASLAQRDFVPLAAVSVPRTELVPNRQVPVDASYPGVGGWVVFGVGIENKDFFGRFSTVQQSMLAPRASRAYLQLPIPEMSKIHQATALTGLVLIKAGNDIEVLKDARLIDGELRDAMIIRLDTTKQGTDLLSRYIGPCGVRPESRNCSKPAIEALNSVRPDCNGNINIRFTTTCIDVGKEVEGSAGLVLDYCLGLAEACHTVPRLGDFVDACETVSDALPSEIPTSLTSESLPLVSASSETLIPASSVSCAVLPQTEHFNGITADSFTTKNGGFVLGGGFYTGTSITSRNLAVFEHCSYDHSREKNCEVYLQLQEQGSEPNGGIAVGYQQFVPDVTAFQQFATFFEYFVVELWKPNDSFRVRFWSGAHAIILATANPVGLIFDHTYRIRVETRELTPGNTTMTCKLYDGVTLLATIAVTTIKLDDTTPSYFGIQTERATAKFDSFFLEEV